MPFSRHKGFSTPCQDLLLCHCDASELGSEILVYHGEPHLRYCLLDDVPRYSMVSVGDGRKGCLQVQLGVLVWLCEDIFRLKCLSETSEKNTHSDISINLFGNWSNSLWNEQIKGCLGVYWIHFIVSKKMEKACMILPPFVHIVFRMVNLNRNTYTHALTQPHRLFKKTYRESGNNDTYLSAFSNRLTKNTVYSLVFWNLQ